MRNIPMFTTEFGVASLVLKEIPYTQTAYIHLHSSLQPDKLLKECVGFCRAAGAERIYAAGDDCLKTYPLHTRVLAMQCVRGELADTTAQAVPVREDTLDLWRENYNRKMADVDHAAYMDEADAKKMLLRGEGYFVEKEGKNIGIAMASEEKLLAVASLVPGGGRDSVLVLKKLLQSKQISLEVASTNHKAICLYERLGFVQTAILTVWYKIL